MSYSNNIFTVPDFVLSGLKFSANLDIPKEVYGVVWIDKGKCLGCFSTERFSKRQKDGTWSYTLKCYLDIPKCQCKCRVVCGSHDRPGSVVSFGKDPTKWEIIGDVTTEHPDCERWEIRTRDCDDC